MPVVTRGSSATTTRITESYGDRPRTVVDAAEQLMSFLRTSEDPIRLSKGSNDGPRRPLLVLLFDESHCLTEQPPSERWTLFSELRHVLRLLNGLAIFSLFLSTACTFHLFSPESQLDMSARVINQQLKLLPPITETGFDELAIPVKEGVTLDYVATEKFMCHLGRPL